MTPLKLWMADCHLVPKSRDKKSMGIELRLEVNSYGTETQSQQQQVSTREVGEMMNQLE